MGSAHTTDYFLRRKLPPWSEKPPVWSRELLAWSSGLLVCSSELPVWSWGTGR